MKFFLTLLLPVMLLMSCCDSADPSPDIPNEGSSKMKSVSYFMKQPNEDYKLIYKEVYFYTDAGQLARTEFLLYNSTENSFDLFSTTVFTFEDGRLRLSEKTQAGTNVKESVQYAYNEEDRVSRMLVDSDIDTDIAVTYEPGDSVQAFYQVSSGNSFTYRFFVKDGNIAYDKTLDGARKLTSEKANLFDTHINPYSLLGYMDTNFVNFSKNNKVSIASVYYSGSAEYQPESYQYSYNEAGLPLTQWVTYKTSMPNPQSLSAKYVYEYDQ